MRLKVKPVATPSKTSIFNSGNTGVYASLFTSVLGAATSAYGQRLQGEAEARRLQFNANVAEDNAKNAEYGAEDAIKRGKHEERKYRQRVNLFIGKQRAAFGGSGVDVTTGAPADVIAESIRHGEDDAATIRYNAAVEAWSIKAGAAGYRGKALLSRMDAEGAALSSEIAAGSTLLTGLGTATTNYALWRQDRKKSNGNS